MLKHTSGPWSIDVMNDPETYADNMLQGDWIAIESEQAGGYVAYCHPINAPLISAAPDMLEVLEYVNSVLDYDGYEDVRAKVHAVINKAKGE